MNRHNSNISRAARHRRRLVRNTAILTVILVTAVLLSLTSGRYPLTAGDIVRIILGRCGNAMTANVFLKIRLPRVIFSVTAGASLAAAGLVYQELFSNPLVSPDVLGVSGGAGAGAAAAIISGFGMAAVTGFALAGGIAAVLMSLGIAHLASRREAVPADRTVVLILAGIVVKAAADSAVMAMKYTADPEKQLPVIDYWLMGSLGSIRTADVLTVLPLCVIPLILLALMRSRIAVLSLGDEDAAGLGAEVKKVKYLSVILACIPVAAVTSAAGVISWVGLIVPHAVRRFFGGGSIGELYPLCLIAGGAFMTLADTAARSFTEAEIPVSIITSLAGGILLCVFLLGKKQGAPGGKRGVK